MEPGFNPALEAQAIGRVHRLGQKRSVEICRLIMKDSFESRMVKFLEKKYQLTFDEDPSSDAADKPAEGRPEDDEGDGDSDETEKDETEKDETSKKEVTEDKKSKKKGKKAKDVLQAPMGNLQTERAQVVTEEFDELFGVLDKINESSTHQDDQSVDGGGDEAMPDAAMSTDI